MRKYSDVVLKVLRRAGWYSGRDVFDMLEIQSKKRAFRAAKEIFSELGLLKLEYIGSDGEQIIFFDVDDSDISKNMRAEMFGFETFLDPSLQNEPDFEVVENFKWTEVAESFLNKECSRVGVIEDEIGYSIFVTEDGSIYLAHGEEPFFAYKNVFDFLNSTVLGCSEGL